MLVLEDISFKTILKNISFTLNAHHVLSIIGPNGSGKTTLLSLILGMIKPTKGSIKSTFKTVSYVPQSLFNNQALPLSVESLLKISAHDTNDIDEVMKRFEIFHLKKQLFQNLSGGQRQRVLFARAILKKPDLLVLDEPTQGVDIAGQEVIYQAISDYKQHASVIYVSHDLHFVMKNTDYVICLNGHICCEGKPEDVSKDIFTFYAHKHNHYHL